MGYVYGTVKPKLPYPIRTYLQGGRYPSGVFITTHPDRKSQHPLNDTMHGMMRMWTWKRDLISSELEIHRNLTQSD